MTFTYILVISCLFTVAQCHVHVLKLEEGLHAKTAVVEVEEGSNVILKCESDAPNVRWLHSGFPLKEKYVQKSDERTVEIDSFDSKKHNGVYECSSEGMSASYRLRGSKKYELPTGFRYCIGEEYAKCHHSTECTIDIASGFHSCVCEHGWAGENCDVLDVMRSFAVVNANMCPYWPPVVTLMVFLFVVFLIGFCLHRFKVKDYNNRNYERVKRTADSKSAANV